MDRELAVPDRRRRRDVAALHDDGWVGDERERANLGRREPERLAGMRADWEAWNAGMPAIPDDAAVSLGYGAADMPGR